MVLSMDNTCSAASFDMELCAEKLQSLGVQVSSSPLISPGGPLEWMLAGLTLFAPRSQRAFLSFFFFLGGVRLVCFSLISIYSSLTSRQL